jgi:hypothetical protein
VRELRGVSDNMQDYDARVSSLSSAHGPRMSTRVVCPRRSGRAWLCKGMQGRSGRGPVVTTIPRVLIGLSRQRLLAHWAAKSRERGPEVHISSPPPLSLSQCGPADAVRQSRHCGAGLGLVGDVRKGRAGYGRTRFGPVSLTGIDAVPLRQSADRWQRWPAAVRARSAAYLLVVRLSLRAVCAARSSPMADRVRSNASR